MARWTVTAWACPEFVLARIAEDESIAQRAQVGTHGYEVYQVWEVQDWIELDSEVREHVDRHSPWRVLAECAAKRAIVGLHTGSHECSSGGDNCAWIDEDSMAGPVCDTLRALALPYADHPDFDPDWRAGVTA